MIIQTADGSHSLQSPTFEVSYHSKHGAIQETQHVFINAAFNEKIKTEKELAILGIGFGTGLNAYMTYLEATQQQIKVNYTAVEAYPIDLKTAKSLNYPTLLKQPTADFLEFHTIEWEQRTPINAYFEIIKLKKTFQELTFQNTFDIIYFDAFAPTSQPELWETAVLQIMYDALKKGGILTTYCAKGVVKRTLKAIGFTIEAIPGPPGKREMTRATK